MTRAELEARWSAQREAFRCSGALVDGARVIDLFLNDLANVNQSEADELLTLRAAASWCGYSVEHLARLIRQGRLPNAGRKGAPRIRMRDLPSRKVARTRTRSYDVNADARTLKNGRQ